MKILKELALIFITLMGAKSFAQSVPTITAVYNGSRMCNGSVTLSATSDFGTINWYAEPLGDTALATGNTFITPYLTFSYTYYVDATYQGETSPVRTPVTATVTPCSAAYLFGESIKGRWYHVKTTGGIGGIEDYETPVPDTYIEIIHLEGKDSIIWKSIENCRLAFQKKCKISYTEFPGYPGMGLFYFIDGPDVLNVVNFNTRGFSMGWAEARDQYFYWYEKIDTFRPSVIPVITSITNGSRCGPGDVELSASSNAGNIKWYASPDSGSPVATGNSFIASGLNETTVFYAEADNHGCTNMFRTAVTARLKEYCHETDSLSGLLTGRWYTTGAGSGLYHIGLNPVAGDSIVISRIENSDSISGIYYHNCLIEKQANYEVVWDSSYALGEKTWMLINPENEIERLIFSVNDTFVTITIDSVNGAFVVCERIDTFSLRPQPQIINTADNYNWRCGPGTVTLHAQANTGTIRWYDALHDEAILGTGDSYTTPMLTENTAYYVDAIDNGCVSKERMAVLAKIEDCSSGGDSVAFVIQGRWYLVQKLGGYAGGGFPIIVPSPGDSVIITRLAGKDSIVWSEYHQCKILNHLKYKLEFRTALNDEKKWIFVNDGSAILSCDLLKILAGDWLLLNEEHYDGYGYKYVHIDTFSLHEAPRLITVINGARCGTGQVTLGASADPGTVNWYASSTDEIAMGSGNTFVTPEINSTTIFYADASHEGCITPRMPVTALIITGDTCMNPVDASITPKIEAYPNPTSGKFQINLWDSFDAGINVEIFNSMGGLVDKYSVQTPLPQVEMDFAKYNTGIYVIRLQSGNRITYLKVIKE
jgi:hypothetical protein